MIAHLMDPLVSRATSREFSKKTAASWEWARERAHRRRYEEVLEIVPRTNSIVSIIWWIDNSIRLI